MSLPQISPPSTTDAPSATITTDTNICNDSTPKPTPPVHAANPSTMPPRAPTPAAQRYNHLSTPLTNPLVRELHDNLDRQGGIARGYHSREAEIDKTRALIAQKTELRIMAEVDAPTMDLWIAAQERWIKWLETDMEKLKEEFFALEEVEVVLKEKIEEGKVGKGKGKEGGKGKGKEKVEVLAELEAPENGKGVVEVDGDGDTDGHGRKAGDEATDGKSEDGGAKAESDGAVLHAPLASLPKMAHTQDTVEMQRRVIYELENINRAKQYLLREREMHFSMERHRLLAELSQAERLARALMVQLWVGSGVLVYWK
ncbi:hypothetical protein MMC26_005761 [Xylographa opegraphella]|nr:hypothetical protein [Xylographa opegraphella]